MPPPNSYGLTQLATTGRMLRLLASNDGDWMPIGATIAWSTVAVQGAATVSSPQENTPIPLGAQFLRYGQPMTRITRQPVQTLTQTGASTLTAYNPITQSLNTYALGAGANAAAVQAAMDSLFGAGNTVVTGAGPFTVTFQGALIGYPIQQMTATAGVTFATTSAGGDYGSFGPYDPAATDGRQTISVGNIGIMDKTVIAGGELGFTLQETAHGGLLIGGSVWKQRLIATTGTHSLAAGPTFAELLAVLPGLKLVGGF